MDRMTRPQEPAGRGIPKYVPHTCGHCGMMRQTLNGAWLRARRLAAGMGLRELARASKVSAAYLSDVERGNRHATPRAEAAYLDLKPR